MKYDLIGTLVALFFLAISSCTADGENLQKYAFFTKQWEGYSAKPYRDGDNFSVGYGFYMGRKDIVSPMMAAGVSTNQTRSAVIRDVFNQGVSKGEALALLQFDISRAYGEAKLLFPSFDSYPRNVRLILVDLSYNLGYTRLSKFVKFRAAIDNKDWPLAASELVLSRWYVQTGRRAKNHVRMLNREP